MKQSIKNIFYENVIFVLKLNFFKKIQKLFVNTYFIGGVYCFDCFCLNKWILNKRL